ncbi:uncharacterized protein LOC132706142 isoform X2 [Cylas formicarius]|uniref:uncharacterized protein LOC132706142 isoform X2 n=1 Tax=Cylas formicarius TaxID=197179 RepID=UPI00295844D1|nr:uncharacterized protein LOC132706142 isoform X2 [Cylas formicarius]
MSTVPDDVYCTEQISIPPAFPYLLRQYAKAAIRTQPVDLLRWSSAYFRCLSLNIPPPVKPRLEYPVPRDHHGVTPGWLKTLNSQMQNNQTTTFRYLWDRWIGACFEHSTLVQILCLGGFDDPNAIPCRRFIALCAAHLTDDLSCTMILVCEILTEEPEGGSAAISLTTFMDLYKFLAKIDASTDQVLKNYHFRDSLLALWREKVKKQEVAEEEAQESIVEEPSEETKTSTESLDVSVKRDVSQEIVSCPSLLDDDRNSLDYILEPQEEEGKSETVVEHDVSIKEDDPSEKQGEEVDTGEETKSEHTLESASLQDEDELKPKEGHQPADEASEKSEERSELSEPKPYESVDTIVEEPRTIEFQFEDEKTLEEDLQRLRALQEETAGESDREVEKFKSQLIAEVPVEVYPEYVKEESVEEPVRVESISVELEKEYEDVFVAAVPGIGAVVSDALVDAVADYMKGVARFQHGMVMPRNIRHYSCPPLDVTEY